MSTSGGVSQLRYADPQDGYAFDPQLWTTHDGGSAWHQSTLKGSVTDLAIGDGGVYVVLRRGDHQQLLRSPASHDAWQRAPAPANIWGSLWVQGNAIFAQDSSSRYDAAGKHLLYSPDGGQHWKRAPVPVPDMPCEFDQVKPPVLWERCATGMQAGIWISHDNGMTFRDPQHSQGASAWGNAMVFGAASNDIGVAAFQDLRRTSDGGRSYHRVPPARVGPKPHDFEWTYIGFTDPEHGLAIGAPEGQSGPGQLWASSDAGASWRRVSIS